MLLRCKTYLLFSKTCVFLLLTFLILISSTVWRRASQETRQQARNGEGGLLALAASVAGCILECFYTLIEYLTKFATVMMSITGAPQVVLFKDLVIRSIGCASQRCHPVENPTKTSTAGLDADFVGNSFSCMHARMASSASMSGPRTRWLTGVQYSVNVRAGESFFDAGRSVTDLLTRNFLKAYGVWW